MWPMKLFLQCQAVGIFQVEAWVVSGLYVLAETELCVHGEVGADWGSMGLPQKVKPAAKPSVTTGKGTKRGHDKGRGITSVNSTTLSPKPGPWNIPGSSFCQSPSQAHGFPFAPLLFLSLICPDSDALSFSCSQFSQPTFYSVAWIFFLKRKPSHATFLFYYSVLPIALSSGYLLRHIWSQPCLVPRLLSSSSSSVFPLLPYSSHA